MWQATRRTTRFVVDLDKTIDIRAFTLANPYRVVIDMPQVTFQLPRKAGRAGRGLIKAFRFGLVMQGGSRMVHRPRPPGADRQGVRARGCRTNSRPGSSSNSRPPTAKRSCGTTALNNRPPDAPLRRAERDESKAAGDSRPLIVIDPGHGGIDNGTRAPSGENEKALVLDFGIALAR